MHSSAFLTLNICHKMYFHVSRSTETPLSSLLSSDLHVHNYRLICLTALSQVIRGVNLSQNGGK